MHLSASPIPNDARKQLLARFDELSGTLEDDPRAGLYHELMTTALRRRDSDASWMWWPSIERLIKFIGVYCPDKERKYGRVKEGTHYIEVADRCLRYADQVDAPSEVLAFVAMAHDIFEDNAHLTPRMIVDACWYKNGKIPEDGADGKDWRGDLVRLIEALTDPVELRPTKEQKALMTEAQRLEMKMQRFRSQYIAANNDPSKVVGLVRVMDKECSMRRDNENLCNGIIPFETTEEYYAYLQPRYEVVMMIESVPPAAKKEFQDFFVNDMLANLDTLDVVRRHAAGPNEESLTLLIGSYVNPKGQPKIVGGDCLLAIKKCGREIGQPCPEAKGGYAGATCLERCALHGRNTQNTRKKTGVSRLIGRLAHGIGSVLAL